MGGKEPAARLISGKTAVDQSAKPPRRSAPDLDSIAGFLAREIGYTS